MVPKTVSGPKNPARQRDPEIDWSRLHREAEQRFGVKKFRPGQREIIECVLRQHDVVGILPTGAGKSLTYQLPALLLPKSVVVVSPLISLMQDQQEKAEDAEIDAAKLDSTLTTSETRNTVQEIREGEHDLIYVTPERLENPEYLDLLKKAGVSLFVVDEAHCVSQWGHDFRPAYLTLQHAIQALGHPPVLALTATATPEVAADVIKQLGMNKAEIVNTGIERANLFFEVLPTVNSEAKRERIRQMLAGEREGTGLIYTATIRAANELWSWLREDGNNAERYHSKLRKGEREDIQQRFMNNDVRVLIATKAFGMGVDKPDIRFVVHWNFPDSLESYYQEAGRAGRDGKSARATLLYRLEDRRIQGFFLGGKYPRREHSFKVYETLGQLASQPERSSGVHLQELATISGLPKRKVQVIVSQLEAAGVLERRRGAFHKLRDFASNEELTAFLSEYERRGLSDRERLQSMMSYAQTAQCRMRYLRDYFGEDAGHECGHCDNCRARAEGRLPAANTLKRNSRQRKPPQAIAAAEPDGRADAAVSPEAPFSPPRPEFLQHTQSPALFTIGDGVRHKKFGPGEVIEISGDNVTAKFAQGGTKRVRSEFLDRIA